MRDGKPVGSALIGQPFSAPQYFWGRPSATAPMPDNARRLGRLEPGADQSGAARRRQGPRRGAAARPTPATRAPIPVDLVTASASGLDPHISLGRRAVPGGARRARRASCRIAGARADRRRTPRQPLLGFLGEPRVNVLALNLALDGKAPQARCRRPHDACPSDDSAPRSRRAAGAGAGAGAPRRARQAAHLLRRLGRRRQDLRDAGGRAQAAARQAATCWSASSRPTAAPRPRRCSTAWTCCRAKRIDVPRQDAAPSSTSTRALARAPGADPGRRAGAFERAPARATRSAGRTSRNCWPPASTSSRRSTCSTWKA